MDDQRFRYELKLEKRRKKENLSHHSLEKAKNNFEELMRHIKTFDEAIQKRLRMINSHWFNLTLFYYLPGAPATNKNQIKLAEMKRAGKLTKPDKSLLELFRIFMPFRA